MFLDPFLKTAEIMADFYSFGIIPLWSDEFRSIVSGLLRNSANSKISFGCISSGPEDLFVFRLLSFFSTASTGISIVHIFDWHRILAEGMLCNVRRNIVLSMSIIIQILTVLNPIKLT